MPSTQVSRHIAAPRDLVYQAILDSRTFSTWLAPEGMAGEVHTFDPCEGGVFRFSLTHDWTPSKRTDQESFTLHGLFVKLVPNLQIFELLEFETNDPSMKGEMTVSIALTDSPLGGTDLLAIHDNLPPGLSPQDNESGWRMSLAKLAGLVEGIVAREPELQSA